MNPLIATSSDTAAPDLTHRLDDVVAMMREMSEQTDPQLMVLTYSRRIRDILPADGYVSISRRDLPHSQYRVTRSSLWDESNRSVNPWTEKDKLPVHDTGLFGDLIYAEKPVIINDLQLDPDDPAVPYCRGARSLIAVPMFDQGVSLNMIIRFCDQPNGFSAEKLPELVWMANLFGRATHNLVLKGDVQRAYDSLEREMQVVADIQRSLLPAKLPAIPTLEMAVHYQTSRLAGGDYYDFFALPGVNGEPAGSPNGRWGILIADVSGHGTPAAVLMAVCHSIAHTHDGPPTPPGALLRFLNAHLTARYTLGTGSFITAFYGIYDPTTRELTYSCAGHCPPRLRQSCSMVIGTLDGGRNFPLGIDADEEYNDVVQSLDVGDAVLFYTDGITEGRQPGSVDLFGIERLDEALLDCDTNPAEMIRLTLESLEKFTSGAPPTDDRTLLALRVV